MNWSHNFFGMITAKFLCSKGIWMFIMQWQVRVFWNEWAGRNLLKWMNPLKLRSELGSAEIPWRQLILWWSMHILEYPYPSHIHELHIHGLRWLVAFHQIRPETFLLTATSVACSLVAGLLRPLTCTALIVSYDHKRTSSKSSDQSIAVSPAPAFQLSVPTSVLKVFHAQFDTLGHLKQSTATRSWDFSPLIFKLFFVDWWVIYDRRSLTGLTSWAGHFASAWYCLADGTYLTIGTEKVSLSQTSWASRISPEIPRLTFSLFFRYTHHWCGSSSRCPKDGAACKSQCSHGSARIV